MGLGKSLQAITVIWTLIEQDIFVGGTTCNNGIVICPKSLIVNWENEIKHWLKGSDTFKTYTCLANMEDVVIQNWISAIISPNASIIKPLLIISYESFRSYHDLICYKKDKIQRDIGFVVFDEGHKLKNYKSELSIAVSCIKSSKRLIMTGRPIQNDLMEMYSLIKCVNPGVYKKVNYLPSDGKADKKSVEKENIVLNVLSIALQTFLLQRTSKRVSLQRLNI